MNLFKNLKLDVYYKGILVLFSFLLIISLIIETRHLSNEILFNLSLTSVIYALVMWVFRDILSVLQRQMDELRGFGRHTNYMRNVWVITIIHIVSLFIWLSIVIWFITKP